MNSEFSLQVASHPDYENVTVEIYFQNKFVALLSQEGEQPVVEFPDSRQDESLIARKVELSGFQAALGAALTRLRNS
jgi:hypothetical protein